MLRAPLLAALCALASAAGPASAQATHMVQMSGITFTPADLDIDVGDTVQWNWVSGLHNVESGVGGTHDGIFRSGDPITPPQTFSVTFDQAFLDAHPVAGKVYDYYCAVHVGLGMVGSVRVVVPSAAVPRNAGANPASLGAASDPITGTSFVATVDLTSTGHALAVLFGFDTAFQVTLGGGQTLLCLDLGGSGELLGQSAQPGPTALFSLAIPDVPSLCGLSFSMQAIQFGSVTPFALSNAIDVTLGND